MSMLLKSKVYSRVHLATLTSAKVEVSGMISFCLHLALVIADPVSQSLLYISQAPNVQSPFTLARPLVDGLNCGRTSAWWVSIVMQTVNSNSQKQINRECLQHNNLDGICSQKVSIVPCSSTAKHEGIDDLEGLTEHH